MNIFSNDVVILLNTIYTVMLFIILIILGNVLLGNYIFYLCAFISVYLPQSLNISTLERSIS